jgi:beta-xylosidase
MGDEQPCRRRVLARRAARATVLAWLPLLAGAAPPQPEVEPGRQAPLPVRQLAAQPPIVDVNFPDPFLLDTPDYVYAYATGSGGAHVQAARTRDLRAWELMEEDGRRYDALPRLPAWVRPRKPDVWAPEVMKVGDRYVLYFTARSREWHSPDDQRQCIGVGTSAVPEGPFDPQPEPIVCREFPSGVIDPNPFRDGRKLYLYYKRDGNCCGRGSELLVQDLSPDGLTAAGPPVALGVTDSQPWQRNVVEAPTMFKREVEGDYFLFFSGAHYAGASYAIGFARCETPTGPCTQFEGNPILDSRTAEPPLLLGPGHQSILRHDGRTLVAFHAWEALPRNGEEDEEDGRRLVRIGELRWDGGVPSVGPLRGEGSEPGSGSPPTPGIAARPPSVAPGAGQ